MPLPAPVITHTLPSSLPLMRCVELREFGDPTGLVAAERPDPVPGPGEVLVDLIAAALNRRDWWIRRGGKVTLPQVLGSDGAGVVSAVGPEVEGVSVGDEVVLYPGRELGPERGGAGRRFRDPGRARARARMPNGFVFAPTTSVRGPRAGAGPRRRRCRSPG